MSVTCRVEGCDTDCPGLEDGIWLDRRDGPVCNDCWDYNMRHGHLPDEEPRGQTCVECLLDDGAVRHECEQSWADSVILEPGDLCPGCEEIIQDGGAA